MLVAPHRHAPRRHAPPTALPGWLLNEPLNAGPSRHVGICFAPVEFRSNVAMPAPPVGGGVALRVLGSGEQAGATSVCGAGSSIVSRLIIYVFARRVLL